MQTRDYHTRLAIDTVLLILHKSSRFISGVSSTHYHDCCRKQHHLVPTTSNCSKLSSMHLVMQALSCLLHHSTSLQLQDASLPEEPQRAACCTSTALVRPCRSPFFNPRLASLFAVAFDLRSFDLAQSRRVYLIWPGPPLEVLVHVLAYASYLVR